MNNKGRIVVFMSMITGVFLVLIVVVLQVVVQSNAKSKTVIAGRLSISDIKSCYNSYIFEHYHILLFDTKAGGGEAGIEEQLTGYFSGKLGEGFADVEAAITDMDMLSDDSYAAFDEQIRDYAVYGLAEDGIAAIREKTGGQDGTLPADLKEDMEEAQNEQAAGAQAETEGKTGSGTPDTEHVAQASDGQDTGSGTQASNGQEMLDKMKDADDPRDYTKRLSSSAILNLVLPGDKAVSDAQAEFIDVPSSRLGSLLTDFKEVDRRFDDMTGMMNGLLVLGSWQDALTDTGTQALYAAEVFNSYLETKNDSAVLMYEQEYLIAGKRSDYENLRSVAHRIIGIRFPINYVSLCGQADKMSKLTTLATSIAAAAPYLIPAVKYLLAGCWAYIEAVADTRVLFDGKKAAFAKTSENWITDIDHISESLSQETEDVDGGLDYQAYLTILELIHMEQTKLRMLDLMQINAMQENAEFRIRNAAVGLEADFSCSYDGWTYYFHQKGNY
ncbi:MAG: DUF5702 domain-containing protein [Wujia sp.]|nr:DUF5702 domain-containing protein [Wujia sp.]MDY3726693.1 DUF5702 domain-containing protein [Wujia sp.]